MHMCIDSSPLVYLKLLWVCKCRAMRICVLLLCTQHNRALCTVSKDTEGQLYKALLQSQTLRVTKSQGLWCKRAFHYVQKPFYENGKNAFAILSEQQIGDSPLLFLNGKRMYHGLWPQLWPQTIGGLQTPKLVTDLHSRKCPLGAHSPLWIMSLTLVEQAVV